MTEKNNMEKTTGYFKSADGITDVAYYIYVSEVVKPKGILQISHGMQEHIERYEDFAEFMCQNGYIVCGNDHLGHGKTSESGEKRKGYMGEKNGYNFVVKDLHTMTRIIKKEYPGLPAFLLGHSMGSFFARYYVTLYGDEISGVIIEGTGGPNPISGLGIFLTNVFGLFKGKKARAKIFDAIAFGKYNNRIENPKTPADWITRDETIINKYTNDPYCTFGFTIGGYKDLITIQSIVNKKNWAGNVPKDLPILIVSGEEDPVGDYGKGVMKVYEMLKKTGVKDLTVKLYKGCRHELQNELEPDKQIFYNDVLEWLEARI